MLPARQADQREQGEMKKALYTTTAIIGANLIALGSAQAAEGVKIGLSGFMNTYYGVSSRDADEDSGSATADSDRNVSHFQDATVNFIGSTTLDNGIEVGVRFELESFGHPQDEQFMWFAGEFGELSLGLHDSAAYRLSFDAGPPSFTSGIPINSGWINTFIPAPAGFNTAFYSPALSTSLETHNDGNTIGYITPRIAGFKFGVSWTPEPANPINGQFGPVDQALQMNNAISAGASYVQDFDGVGLSLMAGFDRAFDNEGPAPAAANGFGAPGGAVADREQYMAGIGLSYKGVSLGFDWAHENHNVAPGSGFQSSDGSAYSAGIAYTTGPWTASADWISTEVEGSPGVPGDDELTAAKVGLDYALGPGITLSGTLAYADWEEEAGDDLDAVAGILGTTLVF